MKAATQENQPETPLQAHKSKGGQLYTQEEIETAIKRKFSAEAGQIAIKRLWSLDSMHRFRVNWWGKREKGIIRSLYLIIVADEEGIEIKIKT